MMIHSMWSLRVSCGSTGIKTRTKWPLGHLVGLRPRSFIRTLRPASRPGVALPTTRPGPTKPGMPSPGSRRRIPAGNSQGKRVRLLFVFSFVQCFAHQNFLTIIVFQTGQDATIMGIGSPSGRNPDIFFPPMGQSRLKRREL